MRSAAIIAEEEQQKGPAGDSQVQDEAATASIGSRGAATAPGGRPPLQQPEADAAGCGGTRHRERRSAARSRRRRLQQQQLPPAPVYSNTPLAAFSVRYIVPGYVGPVFQVRNTSTGALADFYPNAQPSGYISHNLADGTSFIAWSGGTAGTIQTWYDQSGNGNDATQTTAANQPALVAGSASSVFGSNILYTNVLGFLGKTRYLTMAAGSTITASTAWAQFYLNPLAAGAFATLFCSTTQDLSYRFVGTTPLVRGNNNADWIYPTNNNNVAQYDGAAATSSTTLAFSTWHTIAATGTSIQKLAIVGGSWYSPSTRSFDGEFHKL